MREGIMSKRNLPKGPGGCFIPKPKTKTMSHAKETPRQKMIGMMYLVLTALLALQVSSAVILKFQSLNDSLERSYEDLEKKNFKKLATIEAVVNQRGNKPNEVAIKKSAKEVNTRSQEMIKYIEGIKKDLIQQTGGYDDDGNLKGAKEETEVEVMMIGSDASKGKGYELKNKLNAYVEYINKVSPVQYAKLALDASEDPLFMNHPDQKNKDFAQLNFGQTPLAAGLAVLSEFESRITTMESGTLAVLSDKIAGEDYKFDRLVPMVKTNSRIVPAGTKYEAEIIMSATSSTIKPEMTIGENALAVDANGVGSYSFTASGGGYNEEGFVKKTWSGKIRMKKDNGQDTVYNVTEEYIVAKPVIQIKSGNIPALYKNCGNKLNVQVPALGNAYNPVFTPEGATVIKEKDKGAIVVIPTSANVNLKVSSGGAFIGEQKFRIKLIPDPDYEVKVMNKLVDPYKGIDATELRNVNVKAKPEKGFAISNPDDSYYQIVEWKATLVRGRTGKLTKPNSSESADLSSMGKLALPNDKLIVEILKVKRRTYTGAFEEANVPKKIIIIPIN
jgi:gliding motility-associated protein GldM